MGIFASFVRGKISLMVRWSLRREMELASSFFSYDSGPDLCSGIYVQGFVMGPNPCSVGIDRSRDHGTEREYGLETFIVCSRLPSVDRISTAAVQSSLTQCRFKPLRRGRGGLPRQNRVAYRCNCCEDRQPGTPPRPPCRELTQRKEQSSVLPRSYLFQ